MIVTFCGHSRYSESKKDEEKITSLLNNLIGENDAELYLGGYGAFDNFARKCGKKYQQSHPNTKLVFITPYITVEYQKNHLSALKNLYDEIIYPELEKIPLKFSILYRNRWMVEQADFVIAYINHDWGGAFQTYKHAKRKKKTIYNIASDDD